MEKMDNNCQLVLVQTVWVALKNHHFSTSCIANLCNQIMLDSGQKWKELFHTWDTGPFSTEYTFHIPSVIIYSSICSSSSAWNPSIFSPCTYPLESVQCTCSLWLRYPCFWWLVYLYGLCWDTKRTRERQKSQHVTISCLLLIFVGIFSLHSLFILHAEKITSVIMMLSMMLFC